MPPSHDNVKQQSVEGRVFALEERADDQDFERGQFLARLSDLEKTIGKPPNRVTGEEGSGMAATIHKLDAWLEKEQHRRSLPVAIGRTVVSVIIPIVLTAVAILAWASQHVQVR